MKVKSISVENIGSFENLEINFSSNSELHRNVSVIIGNNGAGKTIILRSIAIALSWWISRLRSSKGSGNPIPEDMITNGKGSASLDVTIEDKGSSYGWSLVKARTGHKTSSQSQLSDLNGLVDVYRQALTDNKKIGMPLVAFYSIERAVIDVPLQIKKHTSFTQLEGYPESLISEGINFKKFFEWFRWREDIENEFSQPLAFLERLQSDPKTVTRILHSISNAESRVEKLEEFDFKGMASEVEKLKEALSLMSEIRKASEDKHLNSVRNAIYKFMPGFSDLHVRRKPRLELVVKKQNKTLNISQLSQGEKSSIALVGDIARRLAILNPSLENPLEGDGVILIDEIDMHLHPSWQRDIVQRLINTFPNCQFILTTHSPLVISDCKEVLIYSLNDGAVNSVPSQYGEDANSVLLNVMDTHIRNVTIAEKLNDLLDLIQAANSSQKIESAKKLLNELADELPNNHIELAKARMFLRKQELKHAQNN